MKIGYIRALALEENNAAQTKLLKSLKVEKIYEDNQKGKSSYYEGLKALIESAREGDTIYIESFNRIAKNTKELLEVIECFYNKKVHLVSIKEDINTAIIDQKLLCTILGAVTCFENDCVLERQREGIERAKAEGKYKGRKKIDFPKGFEGVYIQYKHREITGTAAMEILNLKRNTFYNLIREHEGSLCAKKEKDIEKIAKIDLWLSIENNNKFVRGKKKTRERIENDLRYYNMKKPDPKSCEYILQVKYREIEGLENTVYDILSEIHMEADMNNCIIEADAKCVELGLSW
ncbi:recombinase family protein [Clostridium tagluense]|uniref:recombinase family protein n=1 Tax=Clostridium tagluense TaxID=360422 RepID=UPI001CF5EAB1|nr:recombinase family protein [Clostridium tagluense]MCB2313248.1 recombinase family protein [Clostridium tagluense]MCB2318001.1 recombinase family protein [Clostridium tagluense]MCB2322803.1 recombinase family protein [Clostridium tagluense]MCB2327785.1 recombinase family protein [Clostridium tagluense]MCB2332432.1 recombinase family protein [Clostridium tagluense]